MPSGRPGARAFRFPRPSAANFTCPEIITSELCSVKDAGRSMIGSKVEHFELYAASRRRRYGEVYQAFSSRKAPVHGIVP